MLSTKGLAKIVRVRSITLAKESQVKSSNQLLFLQTLDVAQGLSANPSRLSADQVNSLAQTFGLENSDTLRIVEDLKREGFVELHWGGELSVTSAGKQALRSAHPSQVYVGDNAVYVGPGAQVGSGAALGTNAMAAGAVRFDGVDRLEVMETIARLIAAQQQLATIGEKLPPETQTMTKHLVQETSAIQQELRKPSPSKSDIESRLAKAKGVLEQLVGITTAASGLQPTLQFLNTSFRWLTAHLGSIGT